MTAPDLSRRNTPWNAPGLPPVPSTGILDGSGRPTPGSPARARSRPPMAPTVRDSHEHWRESCPTFDGRENAGDRPGRGRGGEGPLNVKSDITGIAVYVASDIELPHEYGE